MSNDSTLRLVLRGHTIAPDAAAAESGGEVFVALQKPPPVGATLEAFDGEHRRLLDVTRVLESDHGDGRRGFFGRLHDDDDGRLAKVGSEHIEAGAPADPADAAMDGGGEPEMGSSYPVPAPVLEPEPSEAIDVGHPMDQPGVHEAAGSESEDEAGEDEGAQEPASDGAKSRGKKRKGRKRG